MAGLVVADTETIQLVVEGGGGFRVRRDIGAKFIDLIRELEQS
jgi:dethiobiotin synthetase